VKRIVAALTVLAALVGSPGPAGANGRFPESNKLFFSPSDPEHLVLRTTFGFLDSKDRGATWTWICEETLSLSGAEDPMVSITPAGTILATTFRGLAISKNGACDWSFAGGELDKQVFIDLTTNPDDPKHVAVFASSYDRQDEAGAIYFESKIWETKDEGQTFSLLGPPLDPSLLGYTLDLTKSDPDRVYVTAVRHPGEATRAFLLTSKDHGKTWTETEVPLVDTERALFIAAVDPVDADRVYLRTSNGTDKPSRLLFNADGGATWTTIYQGQGPLLGFALSDDGSKVYVGGPKDGIRVASTADFAFRQTSSIEAQCLAVASDGLWACSNEKSGFVIALSKDEGATFEKETHFCDIAGPLTCPAGTTTNTTCPGRWPSQKALLGCGGDFPPGDGGARADAGLRPDDDDDRIEPGGGCDCRMSPTSPLAAFASAGLALAAVLTIFRRARRR
jgi:MYXO-CTERM domain-containing protein